MTEETELRQLKARMDICEAGLEAAGYLVWDKKKGRFLPPGGAETAPEEKDK